MSGFETNEPRMMVGARGGGYGLDAELARKKAANYDYNAEHQCQEWIEQLTGEQFPGTFAESLKDGVLLCKLINAIKPDTIKKIPTSKLPFKQMENISIFLRECRKLGVAEHSLFETVDLFEEKDLGLVIQCLFSVGSTVQTTVPTFQGPHLGAKMHVANKREFSPEQRAKGKAVVSKLAMGSAQVMQRAEITRTGITFGAQYAGTGDSTTMTHCGQGSYGIMDRAEVVRTGICMGAEYTGTSESSVVPQSSMGSYGIMDRAAVSRANNITFGADQAGPGDSGTIPLTSQGSFGIMDRTATSRSHDITFAAEASAEGAVRSTGACTTHPSLRSKASFGNRPLAAAGSMSQLVTGMAEQVNITDKLAATTPQCVGLDATDGMASAPTTSAPSMAPEARDMNPEAAGVAMAST